MRDGSLEALVSVCWAKLEKLDLDGNSFGVNAPGLAAGNSSLGSAMSPLSLLCAEFKLRLLLLL